MKQTTDVNTQLKRFDKDFAMQQQEDRIQTLSKKEQDSKRMRFEWRKSLENGYETQMRRDLALKKEEVDNRRTGPTTLNALGSHYQNQLKNQKLAEEKQQMYTARVAKVINAPSRLDVAAEVMVNSKSIVQDQKEYAKMMMKKIEVEQSRENIVMARKRRAQPPPGGRSLSPADHDELEQVQVAETW